MKKTLYDIVSERFYKKGYKDALNKILSLAEDLDITCIKEFIKNELH